MTLKKVAAVALAAGLTLTATACGSDSTGNAAGECTPVAEFDTTVTGTLTVAAIQQLPGIDVDVNTGKATGLDSVLLTSFAEQNCLKLDIQPLPGPAAVAAMTEGKADVAGGGWYKTAARGEVLGQSTTLWYDQVGIVAKEPVESIGQLQGRTVGVVGGSLFEKPLVDVVGADSVKAYQSIDQIFKDLEAGRIDAAMGAGATLTIQVADRGNDELRVSVLGADSAYPELTTPGEPNYPFTKTNTALGDALNAFIEESKESGIIAKTLAEYGITSEVALNGPEK